MQISKGRTCILEIHIVAIQGTFQPVAHDLQLHDLLSDGHVWLRDVKLNLGIVDLIGQAVTHHLWEIPGSRKEWKRMGGFHEELHTIIVQMENWHG